MTKQKIKPGIIPNIYQVYRDGEVTIEGIQYYTVRLTAERVGRCAATIRAWIKRGIFDGVRDANPFSPRIFYLIPAAQIEQMVLDK